MSQFISTTTPNNTPFFGRPRRSSASSTISTASSQQSDPELDAFLGYAALNIDLTSHDSSSDDSYDCASDGSKSTEVWLESTGWKKSPVGDYRSVNQDEIIHTEADGTTCDGLCCQPLTDAEVEAHKRSGRRNNGRIIADRIAYRFAKLKWKMRVGMKIKSNTDNVGPPDILTKGYPEFFKFPARRMSTPAADPRLTSFSCAKCHQEAIEGAVAPCTHTFCKKCSERFFEEDACPCCQAPFVKRILASYNPYPQCSDEDYEIDSFEPRTYDDGAEDSPRRKSVIRQIVYSCLVPI